MTEKATMVQEKKPRLLFIDMARSIAILLMLEGHFIGLTLGDEYRDVENTIYSSWNFVRGFTAPMFFTVTGLIFVYLLSAKNEEKFWSNQRVKKGFKRSGELLFWGFMLQVNLFEYLKGNFGTWLFAIHVLQCIGIGIASLLLLYGLQRLIRVISLHWIYFIFALIIYGLYPYFKGIELSNETASVKHFIPEQFPELIQNLFLGPNSVFPIIPWVSFTLLGGALGSLIRKYEHFVLQWWMPYLFVFIGLSFNLFGYAWFNTLDHWAQALFQYSDGYLIKNNVLLARIGQVIIVLGLLMLVDRYANIKSGLFLKIGQNTLPVYVLHVILLYGGITGIGLHRLFKSSFDPYTAVIGAILFITTFIIMVKYLEPLESFYSKILRFLNPFKQKKHVA